MDGLLLQSVVSVGVGAGVAGALLKPYLFAAPKVHQPQVPAAWPVGAAKEDDAELLRCCQINVWSGSTYELEPARASTLYHLFGHIIESGGGGKFGMFEKVEQTQDRRAALVSELKRIRPAVVSLNEAASEAWVHELAAELGMCALWHTGVAVIRVGPLSLPPGIEEGDALLFHPGLVCEGTVRRRLSGKVFGRGLAVNFGDATQAIGALLRTPGGRRVFVVGTHWRATVIEDAATQAELERLASQPALSAEQQASRRAAVLAEGAKIMRAGTAMRVEESEGVLQLLAGPVAALADGVVVLGDLNTAPDTEEVQMLLERGRLVDAWKIANEEASNRSAEGSGETGATWCRSNPNVELQLAHAESAGTHSGAPALPWESAEAAGSTGALAAEVHRRLLAWSESETRRLDYILPGGQLTVDSCCVDMARASSGTVVPSDHYGLVADLWLRSKI